MALSLGVQQKQEVGRAQLLGSVYGTYTRLHVLWKKLEQQWPLWPH